MSLNTIEAENVIFSYFEKNAGRKEVELSTLLVYVRKIDQKFRNKKEWVYINYTKSSLIDAINLHYDMIEWDKNKIRLKADTITESQINLFNSKIPYTIKNDYLKFFDDADAEIKEKSKV